MIETSITCGNLGAQSAERSTFLLLMPVYTCSIPLPHEPLTFWTPGSIFTTIIKNVPSLVLQIFLYLAAFECNTTSDWLSQSEVELASNLQEL